MHINALRIMTALAAATLLPLAASFPAAAAEPPGAAKPATHRVVFQVSDGDPAKWNLVLNNLANIEKLVGRENLVAEIVAFGPGIAMLRFDSPVAERVRQALGSGARVVACENTMAAQKLTRDDMLPGLGYAPAGVVEIIERQQQGYAYIRP